MGKLIVNVVDSEALNQRARSPLLKGRRAKGADGTSQMVYVIDSSGDDVGDQFLRLFRKNAARARRETREAQKARGVAAE